MPLTRIAIRAGKPPVYKQALTDEIYLAMQETVAIDDGDRFMGRHRAHPERVRLRCLARYRAQRRSRTDPGLLGAWQGG